MNLKRQILEEFCQLVGQEQATANIIVIFDNDWRNQSSADYFGTVASQAHKREPDKEGLKSCWEYFREVFEGDEKTMWKFLRSMGNDELLAQLLARAFDGSSEKVHAFLRSVVPEEEVRQFIESDGSIIYEYGIWYEPLT